MSKTFLISDTHFFHANILKFTDNTTGELIRPGFVDVDHMNEYMVDRWNHVVSKGDKVIHLGDVAVNNGTYYDAFPKLWARLNGSKTLIVGNHDDIPYLAKGGFFRKVLESKRLSEHGIILSHRALDMSNLYNARTGGTMINVHGHIHQNKSPEGPYLNISVERIGYTPVELEDLAERLKNWNWADPTSVV